LRSAFFFLLLVNCGFWAWVHWVIPAPRIEPLYDGPGMTLLREVDRGPPVAAPVEPSVAPTGAPCTAIGPFVEAADADAAADALRGAGYEPARSSRVEEIRDGFWVYIGDIDSEETARAILDELTRNGVEDAYMIPDSERGILISLGVYSRITRAGIEADRVSQLGFEATIADRMRVAQTIWLEVTVVSDGVDPLALLQQPGRINRLEQRACDDNGG
jgi:hypothetical protein